MFSKYGYTTIGIVAIITFIFIAISIFIQNIPSKVILISVAAITLGLTLNFFRDPDRTPPNRTGIIVSPADGKVLFVKPETENRYINGDVNKISIFMSPINVHVNRIPLSGVVEYMEYFEGKYIAAFEDKASLNNERMETGLNSTDGKILFVQVAGLVARRIINELNIGDSVIIGERFGMIKFGSRLDIYAPLNWKPVVKKDEIVTAGESILFELIQ